MKILAIHKGHSTERSLVLLLFCFFYSFGIPCILFLFSLVSSMSLYFVFLFLLFVSYHMFALVEFLYR